MIKAPINLQDLRRRIYIKAKAEKDQKFWGMYVHICKLETLKEAYRQTKENDGSPGIDGITFQEVEKQGKEEFLIGIQNELQESTYEPKRYRNVEIPKSDGYGLRKLSIPTIKDRVVETAVKIILEPIFEAEFQEGSYGYRPGRNQAQALKKVQIAILTNKTIAIDIDIKSYFDTIRHHILLAKIAKRISDEKVMHLIKIILKNVGKTGVGQGSPLAPLLANIYLNEVDKMLEKAIETTKNGQYTNVEYARFADDLTVLVSNHPKQRWIAPAIIKRLKEELAKLMLTVNEEKTRVVDLRQDTKITFLGFDFRRVRSRKGRWFPLMTPKNKARTKLLKKIKQKFKQYQSQPIQQIVKLINPILQGWVNYFRIGHSSKCFGYIEDWVVNKIRKHLNRCRKRPGFSYKEWSRDFIYQKLGLFCKYKIQWIQS